MGSEEVKRARLSRGFSENWLKPYESPQANIDISRDATRAGTTIEFDGQNYFAPGDKISLPGVEESLIVTGIDEHGRPITSTPHDPVNHPSHYTSGSIECIDAIEAALTPEEFRGFCKGNSIKYVWRSNLKGNHDQDLSKARWYLDRVKDQPK